MIAPANSACRIASSTAHNTRGADGMRAEFAITAQNSVKFGGRGNYKRRVESVECKVKGCPDFTALSIPHNQFTAHNAACAASSGAAPFAFLRPCHARRKHRRAFMLSIGRHRLRVEVCAGSNNHFLNAERHNPKGTDKMKRLLMMIGAAATGLAVDEIEKL